MPEDQIDYGGASETGTSDIEGSQIPTGSYAPETALSAQDMIRRYAAQFQNRIQREKLHQEQVKDRGAPVPSGAPVAPSGYHYPEPTPLGTGKPPVVSERAQRMRQLYSNPPGTPQPGDMHPMHPNVIAAQILMQPVADMLQTAHPAAVPEHLRISVQREGAANTEGATGNNMGSTYTVAAPQDPGPARIMGQHLVHGIPAQWYADTAQKVAEHSVDVDWLQRNLTPEQSKYLVQHINPERSLAPIPTDVGAEQTSGVLKRDDIEAAVRRSGPKASESAIQKATDEEWRRATNTTTTGKAAANVLSRTAPYTGHIELPADRWSEYDTDPTFQKMRYYPGYATAEEAFTKMAKQADFRTHAASPPYDELPSRSRDFTEKETF